MVVVALVAQLAGSARADGELAHTKDVVERHATSVRRLRIGGAVLVGTGGIALGVAGYRMAADAQGFLSSVDKAYGYTMLGTGAIFAVLGPVLLLSRSDVEKMRDELTDAQDAKFARTDIANRAASGHKTRMMLRTIGLMLVGVGGVGVTAAVAGGDSIDHDTHIQLLGAGIAFGAVGTGFTVASLIETRWESVHDDLQQPSVPVTANVVPVRGGAIAGVSGTF